MNKTNCGIFIQYIKTSILALILSIISLPNTTYALNSICQRVHSCPSDSGSYICGDLGFCALCPDNMHCKNGEPLIKSVSEIDLQNMNQGEIAASMSSKHYNMQTGHPKFLNISPEKFDNMTTLKWEKTTTRIDGTVLDAIEGYRLYYGKTLNTLGDTISVEKNDVSIVIYNFSLGTWCFNVTAFDTSENESKPSNGVCVDIQ